MNMQKSVVIKYGGNAMTEPDIRKKVLAAAVKLKNKGIIPVLVHGGGPYINKALNERGRESKFLKGLRCTDKDTMEVVIQVLCGSVNKGLTAEIESLGSRAIGLSGADGGMIKAVRYSDDKELGFAGKVSSIQSDVIELALNNGYIPVISSVGYDIHGQAYNINADMVAGHIGAAVNSERVIFMTDVDGVFLDKDLPESLISELSVKKAEEMIDSGAIAGGMIPKVKSCMEALELGIKSAVIINGKKPEQLMAAALGEYAGTRFFEE